MAWIRNKKNMKEEVSTADSAAVISKMIKNVKEKDVKPGLDLSNIAEEMVARRAKNLKNKR